MSLFRPKQKDLVWIAVTARDRSETDTMFEMWQYSDKNSTQFLVRYTIFNPLSNCNPSGSFDIVYT